VSPFKQVRAGRSQALAFLRIGEDFSPDNCAAYLRAYRARLQEQLRATHDRDDRADLQELTEGVTRQITALESRPNNDPAVVAARSL
jgi:hypothetical protein